MLHRLGPVGFEQKIQLITRSKGMTDAMDTLSISELIHELDCEDMAAREYAKRELIKYGCDAITPLIAAMKSQAGRKSWESARILYELDDPVCIESMIEMVTSSNPLIGSIAINVIEAHLSPSIISKLSTLLPDCCDIVQLQIVGLLEEVGDQRAVESLVAFLEKAHSPTLRYTIIQALGVLGDSQIADLLGQFLNDPDQHVQKRTRIALERLNVPSKPQPLNQL
jgi:HEAT repeat protein